MPKLVIADAGPLIALARLHQLALLSQLFDRVLVTDEVIRECTCRSDFAESSTIDAALQDQVLQRCVAPASHFELALHVGGDGAA